MLRPLGEAAGDCTGRVRNPPPARLAGFCQGILLEAASSPATPQVVHLWEDREPTPHHRSRRSSADAIVVLAIWAGVVVATGAIVAGCWDRREINQLAIVATAGVDVLRPEEEQAGGRMQAGKETTQFRVTAEFHRPRAMVAGIAAGGAAAPGRQVSIGVGTGWTLAGAIYELDVKMPRHPYWAHQTAAILGEDFMRRGILEVLDLWDRDPEIRRSTLVLMSRGLAAEIVTRSQGILENSLGDEILGISRVAPRSGYGNLPTINSILVDLTGDTACTLVPIIIMGPDPEPARPGPVPEGQQPKAWTPMVLPTARLQGAGVVYRDELVGELNPRETRGVMWMRNKVQAGTVTVECPDCGRSVALDVTRSTAQVGTRLDKGKLQGSVRVRLEGNLAEQGCECDLTTERAMATLQRRLAEAVRNEIAEAVAKTRIYGTDLAGFGPALHRTAPRLWRTLKSRWPQEYRALPVTIEVRASLRRTGLSLKPPRVR